MSKTFFTRDSINSYVNYNLDGQRPIENALGGYELKTYDEFMIWWNDYPEIPNTRNKSKYIKEIEKTFARIFTYKCTDVNELYIYDDIQSLSDDSNFDALFAVNLKTDINPNKFWNVPDYQKDKSKSVGGFIIVQKGECTKLPGSLSSFNDVYSVNLICSNNVKGQLLLGAYLFILKTTPKAQVAILELAGGYTNIPGFISYSKLGFKKDTDLYGEDCFMSLSNLTMSKYLIIETPDDIIKTVVGDVELVIPKENRAILNFYKSNKDFHEEQQKLGVLLNILYRMELHPNEILTLLINVYNEPYPGDKVSNYDKMQNFFGDEETDHLTNVFYNTVYFDDKFVKKEDYKKCDNVVDYRKCNILPGAYPKIIDRIFLYYNNEINDLLSKNKINDMILLDKNGNSKRILDDDCNEKPNNKNCKTVKGGKRQKTNKKHRHYKKKTSRNTKNKPKYKNKKLVKTRKNQKNKNY